MADKITNIEDYRRASALHGDTVENIRIEDPLDFLSANEKDEYNAARRRDAEKLTKQTESREKEASSAARAMSERERARLKEATDDPLMDRRPRKTRDIYEEEDDFYDSEDDEDEDEEYDEDDEDYDEDDDEDDEEEEDDDGEDSHGLLIAAGIMAFLIVVVLLFMLWIVFLMPKPEEPEAEERAIQQAQAAEEQKAKETKEEPEEEYEDEDIILLQLPDGFVQTEDTVIVTAESGLNLRSSPDTASNDNIVIKVAKNTELTRVAEDPVKGWSAVLAPGLEEVLFCSSDFVRTE